MPPATTECTFGGRATAPRPAEPGVTEPAPWDRPLARVAVGLVLLGVLWRLVRYLLCFPLWGDEAFVCLNLLDRGFLELAEPCRFGQIVPILFLWAEATAYHLLGGTEWALRLLPLVAGLASLGLFARLCRVSVGPRACALALGILAVSYYPVRHSCEVKPYAFDLLFSLALLLPAVEWLRRPHRWGLLAGLTCVAPVAMLASYPAVFVAGGVSVALLPVVWRRPDLRSRVWYLLYNLAVGAAFLAAYLLVARRQYASYGGAEDYWAGSFPPARPGALLSWLVNIHAGNLFAYPVGGKDGASTCTLLLCLLGVWALARRRRWGLLGVCLAPFGLTLVAAALHRYPYGGSARVAQHLAPAICLLAGVGLASVLAAAGRAGRVRRLSPALACGVFALVGVLGVARDVMKPYKTDGDRRVRDLVGQVAVGAENDPVVVMDGPDAAGPTFEWYLRRQRHPLVWHGQVDWQRVSAGIDQFWCLNFGADAAAMDRLADGWRRAGRHFVLADHTRQTFRLGWEWCADTTEHCEVFHWLALSDGPKAPARLRD